MKLGRRVLVLVSVHKVRRRAVILITEDHLARIVHIFFLGVLEAHGNSPDTFTPVTPYFQAPVFLLQVESRHFTRLVLVGFNVAFKRPEDTVVVVSIGNRDNLYRRIFLHIHDISLVILVLSVMQFIVFMIQYNKVRRHIKCQVTAVTKNRRDHGSTLVHLFTDVCFGKFSQLERLDLVNELSVIDIGMSVHFLVQELIQTVSCSKCFARFVQIRVLTDSVNTALFALVMQLLGSFGQDVLDKRPLDRV